MAKLIRETVSVQSITLEESVEKVLSIPSMTITAMDADTNQQVIITNLTSAQEELLARDIAQVIRQHIRSNYMEA